MNVSKSMAPMQPGPSWWSAGHQGPPKTAQRHKVPADAFKLAWISSTLYPRPDLVLCLSDPLAAAPFLPGGRSWAARAFQDLGISVSVVTLPEALRQRVLDAQRRQYGDTWAVTQVLIPAVMGLCLIEHPNGQEPTSWPVSGAWPPQVAAYRTGYSAYKREAS